MVPTVACSAVTAPGLPAIITFVADGGAYYIGAEIASANADYSLTISCSENPVEERGASCGNPVFIACGDAINTDGNFPELPASASTTQRVPCLAGAPSLRGHWLRFTVPAFTKSTLQVTTSEGNGNAGIAFYTSCGGSVVQSTCAGTGAVSQAYQNNTAAAVTIRALINVPSGAQPPLVTLDCELMTDGSSCVRPKAVTCGQHEYSGSGPFAFAGQTTDVASCNASPNITGNWLSVTVPGREMVEVKLREMEYEDRHSVAFYYASNCSPISCAKSGKNTINRYLNYSSNPVTIKVLLNYPVDASDLELWITCGPWVDFQYSGTESVGEWIGKKDITLQLSKTMSSAITVPLVIGGTATPQGVDFAAFGDTSNTSVREDGVMGPAWAKYMGPYGYTASLPDWERNSAVRYFYGAPNRATGHVKGAFNNQFNETKPIVSYWTKSQDGTPGPLVGFYLGTSAGIKYIEYIADNGTSFIYGNDYYIVYIGSQYNDGKWRLLQRNIQADMNMLTQAASLPANTLNTVYTMYQKGISVRADDVTFTRQQVTFNPGETSKSFALQLYDDTLAEGSESINITLQAPTSPALLTGVFSKTVNILPSDQTGVSNDEYTNPTDINCGYVVTGQLTSIAEPSSVPADPCGYTNVPDRWYRISMPIIPENNGVGQRLTLTFQPEPYINSNIYDGYMVMYKWDGSSLTYVDHRCGHVYEQIQMTIDGGELDTYYIRIGSASPSTNQTFSVSCFSKLQ